VQTKVKSRRGGRRPGAGRPRKPRPPESTDILEMMAISAEDLAPAHGRRLRKDDAHPRGRRTAVWGEALSNASRQRAYRRREHRGLGLATIEYVINDTVDALRDAGRIDDARALRPDQVALEIAGVIRRWVAEVLKNSNGVTHARRAEMRESRDGKPAPHRGSRSNTGANRRQRAGTVALEARAPDMENASSQARGSR
jgi:hypothetical protein